MPAGSSRSGLHDYSQPPLACSRCGCISCGYVVAGLPIDGNCPECNAPIRPSHEARMAFRAAPQYVRWAGLGLRVLCVCALLAIAAPAAAAYDYFHSVERSWAIRYTSALKIFFTLALLHDIVALVGVLIVCRADSRLGVPNPPSTFAARAVLGAVLSLHASSISLFALLDGTGPAVWGTGLAEGFLALLSPLPLGVWFIGMLMTLSGVNRVVARMAELCARAAIAAQARRHAVLVPLLVVVTLPMGIIGALVPLALHIAVLRSLVRSLPEMKLPRRSVDIEI